MTSTALVHTPDAPADREAPVAVFDMRAYLAVTVSDDALAAQQQLAHAYDTACRALIGPNDVQKEGAREFKKKSAWRKLARHFRISTKLVRAERETTDAGHFLAVVVVRAMAPWGQVCEAVGACCTDEATGRRVITTADAIATAETRATNRAVSNLIAMGEVSAEEIGERGPRDGGRAPSAPRAATGVVHDAPAPRAVAAAPAAEPAVGDNPDCPKCGGPMWDDRVNKRNPKAPDFKCKRKGECDGVIWPPKGGSKPAPAAEPPAYEGDPGDDDESLPF